MGETKQWVRVLPGQTLLIPNKGPGDELELPTTQAEHMRGSGIVEFIAEPEHDEGLSAA